jgi:hypothetical protein
MPPKSRNDSISAKRAGQKIRAQSRVLILIKIKPFPQIPFRLIQDFDPHDILLDNRFRAAPQLLKRALPCAIKRSRSSKMDFCQERTGISASRRHKSTHNVSIVWNFSANVI